MRSLRFPRPDPRNGLQQLLSPLLRSFLARQNTLLQPSCAALRALRLRVGRPGASIAIKAAMVAGLKQQRRLHGPDRTFTAAKTACSLQPSRRSRSTIKARLVPADESTNKTRPRLRVHRSLKGRDRRRVGTDRRGDTSDHSVFDPLPGAALYATSLKDEEPPAPAGRGLVVGRLVAGTRRRLMLSESVLMCREHAVFAAGEVPIWAMIISVAVSSPRPSRP